MSEWIDNPKQNPPPNRVMVEVMGSDYMGEFTGYLQRVDYKKSPTGQKKGFRKGWRWCLEDGTKFDDYVEQWRFKDEQ